MQDTIRVFAALLFAYLLGDFPLQSSRLAAQKQRHWWKYVLHGGIHLTLLILALRFFVPFRPAFTWRLLVLMVACIAFHLVVDWGKQRLLKHGTVEDSAFVFLADQALHLAIIAGFTVLITGVDWRAIRLLLTVSDSTRDRALSGGIVYTTVVFAAGYLIRYLTKGLLGEAPSELGESTEQLRNAGLYIGWLERFLIVTAVVLRSPALIGLILTGKSIARFPEMKQPGFAEYFLIGTLLSISMGLLGGLVLLKLWYGMVSLQ